MSSQLRIGLNNAGNTCFLNSVLQALLRCPPLTDYFLRDTTRSPATRAGTKRGPLVAAFQGFLMDVQKATAPYTPQGLLSTLATTVRTTDADWWFPGQQADAAECIQYLLDSLHDAIYRQVRITIHGATEATTAEQRSQVRALESWSQFFAKEYSPIVEHFYGQYQIQIRCGTCGSVSERYEPWLMLKVPIPGGDKVGGSVPTFAECLAAAFEPETIEGYACDTCQSRQPATMTTRISKIPNILLLTFKRFTNTGAKIRGLIEWDLEAQSLRPWMAFRRCPFQDQTTVGTFRTFAVLEHRGTSRGGHYRMFARAASATESNTWLECDDESVRETSVGNVISPDSYVIFATPK